LLTKINATANIPKWDGSENIIFNLTGNGDTLALAYFDHSTLLPSNITETVQIVRKLSKIQKTKFSLLLSNGLPTCLSNIKKRPTLNPTSMTVVSGDPLIRRIKINIIKAMLLFL